jgi:hypothetical protein
LVIAKNQLVDKARSNLRLLPFLPIIERHLRMRWQDQSSLDPSAALT